MRTFLFLLMLSSGVASGEDFPNPLVSISYDQPTGIVTLVGDVFTTTTTTDNEWALEGFDETGMRTVWTNFKPTKDRQVNIKGFQPWCIKATVINGDLKAMSNCVRI